jgi:NDP-sugar pyrophosphorylase family protein
MLQIVIPMAGAGSRFSLAGYKEPKPLISIHNTPMIKVVIDNLTPKRDHKFIFICQAADVKAHNLREKLRMWSPDCHLVELNGLSEGAACSVYAAKALINNEHPVMVANCDQFVDVDINDYLTKMDNDAAVGMIMTMKSDAAKWSFVRLNEDDTIAHVVEKEVISDDATVGIYSFRSGLQLISAIEKMFEKDIRLNGEFYLAPVYNEIIEEGGRVIQYNVGSEGNGFFGIGTPEDLENFITQSISFFATGREVS